MSSHVRDADNGYQEVVGQVSRMKPNPRVDIGIFASDATAGGGSASVLDTAIWNEFGTATIPARSFLRAWFDENQGQCRETLKALFGQVIRGKLTQDKAVKQFALWAVGQIQARIATGISPGNAASTIRKKGSSTPLINNGILRSHVTYAIDGKVQQSGGAASRIRTKNAEKRKSINAAIKAERAKHAEPKARGAKKQSFKKVLKRSSSNTLKNAKATAKSAVKATKSAVSRLLNRGGRSKGGSKRRAGGRVKR